MAARALDDLPTCEKEIKFLVDLKADVDDDEEEVKQKKRVAREALQEWTEQVKVVEGKLSRRTKRVDSLTNEIYQLVALYSVFVGVVFTAVQADRVRCQHVWSPITLCLLPGLVIAVVVEKKFINIRLIRKDIALDEISRRVHLKNLGNLKSKGFLNFDFREHAKEDSLDFEKVWKDNESVTRLGVLVTLLVSLLVTVGSFLHILCFTKSDYGEPGNILPY